MDIRKALLINFLQELLTIKACQATDIQEEEIKMSISLQHPEVTSEKLRCILKSHKTRSTFYTENTMRKLLCKPKDQVATEDKNNCL